MFEPEKLFEWKRWLKMLALWFPVAIPFVYFSVRYDSVLLLVPLILYALFLNWNFFK
ncbi:hypothetical protein [Aquisalinus flavus]|uniref:Uncharacterized protein n=1 Tax=Aquisalinus flavus TaxID=1526572 RepID=A0A8J2V1P9_9PROT|nr:hypothetical protein [Aquisalinus flavus]MBD0427662.1 hypothetical protein [Aquisalinus flavus]GGD02820.1 hypothetical protein GCM10011342_09760 [Aquisalinus flavus]